MLNIGTYMGWQSRGKHICDISIVKRTIPNAAKMWEMPHPSTYYTSASTFWSELHAMLPPGWNTDLDQPIYLWTNTVPANPLWYGGYNTGRICTPANNYLYVRIGSAIIIPPNCPRDSETFVTAQVVHEYGHSLGLNHSADKSNGEGNCCFGRYWTCYDAMDRQGVEAGGCEEAVTQTGLVPYSILNATRLAWITPQVITSSAIDVTLRDIRIYGDAAKLLVPGSTTEYFLIANHQRTLYDNILNGRGALIWHIKEQSGIYPCENCPTTTENTIADLELYEGEFVPDGNSPFCPTTAVDPVNGVDKLDCVSTMLPSAFWQGVTPYWCATCTAKDFAPETNPASYKYDAGADDRRDPQSVASGVSVRRIRSVVDPNNPGKYILKFDVTVD